MPGAVQRGEKTPGLFFKEKHMSEQLTPDQVAQALKLAMGQVNNLMGQQGVANLPAQQPSMMPAPQQQAAVSANGMPNPTGWSVPLEADINGMTVTVYVQFPPHTFPQFQQIISMMVNMGYQVRGFQKNNGGYSGGSNWSNRGGGYGGGNWRNRGGGGWR